MIEFKLARWHWSRMNKIRHLVMLINKWHWNANTTQTHVTNECESHIQRVIHTHNFTWAKAVHWYCESLWLPSIQSLSQYRLNNKKMLENVKKNKICFFTIRGMLHFVLTWRPGVSGCAAYYFLFIYLFLQQELVCAILFIMYLAIKYYQWRQC